MYFTTENRVKAFGYGAPSSGEDWSRFDGGRHFEAFFLFAGWDCLSLGFHVCVSLPNIEIHVPFGYFKIGWQKYPKWDEAD